MSGSSAAGASFIDFLAAHDPFALPAGGTSGAGATGAQGASTAIADRAPHGTTIVASTYDGGVVMAGDRRATIGNIIAQRDIEKVYAADQYSLVGIAGSAGIAMELVRIFQLELEHYEKIEGVPLSTVGKANRLSTLIRSNLGLAMQGLSVVPLFAGYDPGRHAGRIFSYDVTGGRYEEHDFYAVGSGSLFARGSLKKLYRPDHDRTTCAQVCVEALFDAADDDSATGGPDLLRAIYPIVAVADDSGVHMLSDAECGALVRTVVAARGLSPDGPKAPLPALDGGDDV
ncbi:MAG: proteasome subunit beta [Candidatus Nanopelagicales bacterium]